MVPARGWVLPARCWVLPAWKDGACLEGCCLLGRMLPKAPCFEGWCQRSQLMQDPAGRGQRCLRHQGTLTARVADLAWQVRQDGMPSSLARCQRHLAPSSSGCLAGPLEDARKGLSIQGASGTLESALGILNTPCRCRLLGLGWHR